MSLILWSAIAAATVTACAFLMLGGGHGWIAAAISATALLTAPAGAVAWTSRRRRLAKAAVIGNGIADLLFAIATAHEGFRYVADTFEHLAPVVVLWGALWLACQMLPVAALLRRDGRSVSS